MNSKIPRRILRFDPEDKAPSYTLADDTNNVIGTAKQPGSCPLKKFDPKIDAPEFVPSKKRLGVDTDSGYFSHNNVNRTEFNQFLQDLNSPTNSYVISDCQDHFLVDPNMSYGNSSFMPADPVLNQRQFVPACFPFPSTLIPNGYSANFATINGESGAPIAAIILKKKRKRRHRRTASQRISIEVQTDFKESKSADKEESQKFAKPVNTTRLLSVSSEPELFTRVEMDQSMDVCLMSSNKNELNGNGISSGSCPDLSEEQLKLWDEILFKAVQNEREALDHKTEFIAKNRRRTTNSVAPMHSELTNGKVNGIVKRARSNTPAMQTSIYEICAPVEMEQTEEDESCDYNGNDVSKTNACQKISIENDKSPESSSSKESSNSPPDNTSKERQTETQKLAQKLRKELEDLQFRTSYEWQRSDGKVMKISTNPLFEDYPQPNNEEFYPTHMSNYDPKMQAFASTSVIKTNLIHPEECQFEADFFENMSIRVNPFEESVLEEEDCPQPSRFQQLQWAIQRQKERYNDSLQEQQRVCCNIM